MESKIVIFEGNQEQGIFSKAKKFYSENTTEEDIKNQIKEARIKLGEKYKFNGLKMLQVIQKMEDNDDYPDNKFVIIGDEHLTKDDYFEEEIKADILIITSKYKNIALSHRMGDCPVLIAEDREKEVSAIVHCNLYHLNRGLPRELIKTLIKQFNSDPKNIYLYIGSHIHKENYIYDKYPPKATNEKIWKAAIEKIGDNYHIDIERAILNQVKEFNLAEIKISPINTYTEDNYASHVAAYYGNKSKMGQNIVGFYYKDAE
jgi:copper oxidase (laccase) domain-containing protein